MRTRSSTASASRAFGDEAAVVSRQSSRGDIADHRGRARHGGRRRLWWYGPRRTVGRDQADSHWAGERAAVASEGVGDRAPGQPRDVPEPIARRQLDTDGLGDVAGVDPALREPGGGQGPDRELTRDPGHQPAGVVGGELPVDRVPAASDHRASNSAGSAPRCRSTAMAAPSSTLPIPATRGCQPASTSASSIRPSSEPRAISSVWARCSTASARSTPGIETQGRPLRVGEPAEQLARLTVLCSQGRCDPLHLSGS